ncbi:MULTISPECIES: response regulator transcription factor [Nocardia]|uniref:Response regulator transcription factor n=1 Tax=Nocardia implantans TaxID=3108168 RepID=A0ABU6AQ13_9NOCA|nr:MULTISPECIES: response regulator transcription factor [unclassified Nocardia]MBF6189896.1 response regulator transcription factor [Nocardia beijingensis]MEA3526869.1 response regulator transcription factor [Nocardia sp. CDC192]MEB3509553.1 response regulator transcription factor [Nocardia sp. CDC186]
MAGHRILVVDDEVRVLASLRRGLELSDFEVVTAADGAAALSMVRTATPDAMVLDVNLPELDGVGVVTALRAMGNDIPICVLSARTAVSDRIACLERGADDYLTKPFDLGELVARLNALLRRRRRPVDRPDRARTVGQVRIDPAGRRVLVAGGPVELTKREFDVLALLAEHIGVVLDREQILSAVWGYDFPTDTNVVDVFVSYLRRKLEADGVPRVIHTVRGVGFVLREEP